MLNTCCILTFFFRISDKTPAENTGEIFRHYDTTYGLYCFNHEQPDKKCDDYEARVCCLPKCDWGPWYSRDRPSGKCDCEDIRVPQDAPKYGCPAGNAVKVEARR